MTLAVLPSRMARGITGEQALLPDGTLDSCVFMFDKKPGADGSRELSVVWLVNRLAERTLKQQTKDERPRFSSGFAVISRQAVDAIAARKECQGLHYASTETGSNPYHGCIILPGTIQPHVQRMISALLAKNAVKYRYDEPLPVEAET